MNKFEKGLSILLIAAATTIPNIINAQNDTKKDLCYSLKKRAESGKDGGGFSLLFEKYPEIKDQSLKQICSENHYDLYLAHSLLLHAVLNDNSIAEKYKKDIAYCLSFCIEFQSNCYSDDPVYNKYIEQYFNKYGDILGWIGENKDKINEALKKELLESEKKLRESDEKLRISEREIQLLRDLGAPI